MDRFRKKEATVHPEVEFYEDDAGETRWRLKGANGEIVATGEGHEDENHARRAFIRAASLAAAACAELTDFPPS